MAASALHHPERWAGWVGGEAYDADLVNQIEPELQLTRGMDGLPVWTDGSVY